MSAAIVYVTTDSTDEARQIGRLLLDSKLVACVNIIAGMHSMYWWENSIAEAKETILLAKSIEENIPDIVRMIEEKHSYETPCIVTVPITNGSNEFIDWIRNQCS